MRFFLIFFIFINFIYASDKTKIVTEVYEPLQFLDKDDNPQGIAIEIVKYIQKSVGNSEEIKFYPWNRSYNLAIKKKDVMVFSTVRAKQREKMFKWVGPILPNNILFFKRNSDTTNYKTFEEIKDKKITVIRNSICHILLKDMGFKNLDVLATGDYTEGLINMIDKSSDLWVGDEFKNKYIINQKRLSNNVSTIDSLYIKNSGYYLAFNKDTSDEVIQKWQEVLDEMKKDGIIDKIIKKYN